MNTANEYSREVTAIPRDALSGVLTLRVIGFLIDYAIVAALTLVAFFIVTFLGFLTFGLGWFLFPAIFPVIALCYVGFTMGGEKQATPGMAMAGLKIRFVDGGTISPLVAILHVALFWFFMSIPLLLIIGLFTSKKQLLHDLLLETVIVRREF